MIPRLRALRARRYTHDLMEKRMRHFPLILIPFVLIACSDPATRHESQRSPADAPQPTTRPSAITQAPATAPSMRAVDVAEFRRMLQTHPDYVVLDVRTPAEWSATGVIPGATLIDFKSPDFAHKIAQLDPAKTYLVYCRTGNRSGQACQQLKAMNIRSYNLAGGIVAWQTANLPTTRPTPENR